MSAPELDLDAIEADLDARVPARDMGGRDIARELLAEVRRLRRVPSEPTPAEAGDEDANDALHRALDHHIVNAAHQCLPSKAKEWMAVEDVNALADVAVEAAWEAGVRLRAELARYRSVGWTSPGSAERLANSRDENEAVHVWPDLDPSEVAEHCAVEVFVRDEAGEDHD